MVKGVHRSTDSSPYLARLGQDRSSLARLGEDGGGGSPLLAALCHAPGELLLPPLQLLMAARARAETCATLLNKRTTWQELPSAEERKSGSHPNKISMLGCSRKLNICKKL